MDYSAAVLAGGKSKRFGSDKALYLYNDKPLMQWVLDSFADSNDRFIVANKSYPSFELAVYPDIIDSQGPLSGIYTALSYAKNDWLAVAACDMPALTNEYWQTLFAYAKDYQVLVVKTERGLEPLAAFYHSSIMELIKAQIERAEYSVLALLKLVKLCSVDILEINQESKIFKNLNYQKDAEGL